MPNPQNDFVLTQREAKKFRRVQKLHGALILSGLCVSLWLGQLLVAKLLTHQAYIENHIQRYMKCPSCNMKYTVTKPRGVSLSEMKEDGFTCPHCTKWHVYKCSWCGNELF